MEEWSHIEIKTKMEQEKVLFLYLYTPMCGTCQVAGKMVTIVSELLKGVPFGKGNLNYLPELAERWSIQSVPCVVVIEDGHVTENIYAIHSVPYLYEILKEKADL